LELIQKKCYIIFCFRAKSIKTRIETWRTDQIPNSRPDSYNEIC